MRDKVSLSIVLPCHNEEPVIEESYRELRHLLDSWLKTLISGYEIVMVNNGSTDATLEKMLSIRDIDDQVIVLDLRRDYGYQGSITAGLFHASNDVVVSIDADLQDDPVKIAEMIEKYHEGFDLVLGVRSDRTSDGFLKKTTANVFYRFLKTLGVKSVPNHGDFRLISRALLEDFKRFQEKNRYLRGLIFELEGRYATVSYRRRSRRAGDTKFGPMKLISLAWDGISSFSSYPVRLVLIFGLLMFLLSFAGIAYVFIVRFFFNQSVPGWASSLTFFLFFSGVNNLFLGIIGEYISKIFLEVKDRPLFLVRRIYGPRKAGETVAFPPGSEDHPSNDRTDRRPS